MSPSQSSSRSLELGIDVSICFATGSGLVEQAKNTVNSALGLSNKS